MNYKEIVKEVLLTEAKELEIASSSSLLILKRL
jgi:hypothetical protein